MKKKNTAGSVVLMGMLTALLILFSFTPIGSIPIGDLSVTMSVIPVAVGAIALGPSGGAVMGAVFGLLSFLQCLSIGIPSPMGIVLFEIDPFLAFIQRFAPRVLCGLLTGYAFSITKKLTNPVTAGFAAGFFSAFFNTVFFMSALLILFGGTDYVQNLRGGRGIAAYITFIVIKNGILEAVASTLITGAVGKALFKAGLITAGDKKEL